MQELVSRLLASQDGDHHPDEDGLFAGEDKPRKKARPSERLTPHAVPTARPPSAQSAE